MRHLQLRARAGVLYPLAVCGRQRRGLLRAGGGDHGAGEADAAQSGARDARAPPHARAGDLLIHATPLLLMHATPLLLVHETPLLLIHARDARAPPHAHAGADGAGVWRRGQAREEFAAAAPHYPR